MKNVGKIFGCPIYVDKDIPPNEVWILYDKQFRELQKTTDLLQQILERIGELNEKREE